MRCYRHDEAHTLVNQRQRMMLIHSEASKFASWIRNLLNFHISQVVTQKTKSNGHHIDIAARTRIVLLIIEQYAH
jgi:hypothetical protein